MFLECSDSIAFSSRAVADSANNGEMKNCANLSSAPSKESAFTSKNCKNEISSNAKGSGD